jgi:uncharacterized protein (DUF952 family)
MYLYKILSKQDWLDSEALGFVKPLALDDKFIHLAEAQQVEQIVAKFWAGEPEVMIAKLDADKFIGRLVKEKNPGGTTEYNHLYDGKIPLAAVVEVLALDIHNAR